MSKEKLVPELRFPEFKNEGGWEKKSLFDLSDIKKGEQLNRSELTVFGVYPCQNGGINASGYTNKFNTEENTITISEGGNSCGFVNYMTSKFWLGGHCYKLILRNNIIKLFLYHLLKFNEENLMKLRVGSGLPNIQLKAIRDFELVICNSQYEQQKIASCLSSLDEVIAAHSQKLDLLKRHKKGLIQNLFPDPSASSGGETVPKYRFKEFENDGDWVEKKLGEVATFLKGKGISKADIVENGNLPCVRYGELYTHYTETISTIKSHTNLNAEHLVLSKANDVIIPASGETQIDIATASCVLESGIALGSDLNIIRSKINGVFLSYYLNNVKKKDIAQMAQGISVVHLYPNQLKKLQLQIPNSKEQQKIASCLSFLDSIISAQTEKIELLKLHKKGLMQGLFLKIND